MNGLAAALVVVGVAGLEIAGTVGVVDVPQAVGGVGIATAPVAAGAAVGERAGSAIALRPR